MAALFSDLFAWAAAQSAPVPAPAPAPVPASAVAAALEMDSADDLPPFYAEALDASGRCVGCEPLRFVSPIRAARFAAEIGAARWQIVPSGDDAEPVASGAC